MSIQKVCVLVRKLLTGMRRSVTFDLLGISSWTINKESSTIFQTSGDGESWGNRAEWNPHFLWFITVRIIKTIKVEILPMKWSFRTDNCNRFLIGSNRFKSPKYSLLCLWWNNINFYWQWKGSRWLTWVLKKSRRLWNSLNLVHNFERSIEWPGDRGMM
jgi:hypothetical protein